MYSSSNPHCAPRLLEDSLTTGDPRERTNPIHNMAVRWALCFPQSGGREPKQGAVENVCHLSRQVGKNQKPSKCEKKNSQINVEPRPCLISGTPPKSLQFWLFSSDKFCIKDIGMICPILGLPVYSSSLYQESITILELWILPLLPHSRNLFLHLSSLTL